MKTILRFNNRILYNPTKKVISSVLHKSPAYYEMSLYLMKTRIEPSIINHLYLHGHYQTSNGGTLSLHKDMVYLTLGSTINSLRTLSMIKKQMELSKQEVLIHYPLYPEHIKMNESFQKMLGKAWKKNS
jgi:hypothetical protein